MRRYSIGIKIDSVFSDLIELSSTAQFSKDTIRVTSLEKAITKNDVLKFLIYTLYELNSIDMKYFIELTQKLEEVGKMFYGWKNQAEKNIKMN